MHPCSILVHSPVPLRSAEVQLLIAIHFSLQGGFSRYTILAHSSCCANLSLNPQVLIGGTSYKIGDTVNFPVGNTSVVYVITDANGLKANETTSVQVLPLSTYVCLCSSALFFCLLEYYEAVTHDCKVSMGQPVSVICCAFGMQCLLQPFRVFYHLLVCTDTLMPKFEQSSSRRVVIRSVFRYFFFMHTGPLPLRRLRRLRSAIPTPTAPPSPSRLICPSPAVPLHAT